MSKRNKPNYSSLSEIKKNLDPEFSYIIFEKSLSPGESANTQKILNLLSRFEKQFISHDDYCDETGRHLLLVVKLAPIELEYISQEIINIADPEDFSFIIYNSR